MPLGGSECSTPMVGARESRWKRKSRASMKRLKIAQPGVIAHVEWSGVAHGSGAKDMHVTE